MNDKAVSGTEKDKTAGLLLILEEPENEVRECGLETCIRVLHCNVQDLPCGRFSCEEAGIPVSNESGISRKNFDLPETCGSWSCVVTLLLVNQGSTRLHPERETVTSTAALP
jgi:hypothetical protein